MEVRRGKKEGTRNRKRVVVMWNVRRLSVTKANSQRLRRVAERLTRERWERVFLTELKAEEGGIMWLGEEGEWVLLIHGKKAGEMLKREALEAWVVEGQQRWLGETVVAVMGGLRLVSVYQPSWGADEAGEKRCRRDMENQVAMGGTVRLMIGGDYNASVGRDA